MEGTNTHLLRAIRNELINHGESYKSYKDFFRSITDKIDEKTLGYCLEGAKKWLLPETKYHKNDPDTYSTKKMNKSEPKGAIARFFGFPLTLWDEQSDIIQTSEAKKYVALYLDKRDNLLATLNLPSDDEVKDELTIEEYEEINRLQTSTDFKLYTQANPRPNQAILVVLIHRAYELGYYEHTLAYLLPQLRSNKTDIDMLFIEANILGSHQIKEYYQASLILEKIETENHIQYIDLKTAMTSNYLRKSLSEDLDAGQRRDVIYKMSRNYKILFYSDKKLNDYYPAINYAYMIAIADVLYPNDTEFQTLNDKTTLELEILCKASMEAHQISDNSANNYYATITKFEFRLLRGVDIVSELTLYLKENEPEVSLVERSKRQMVFYRDQITKDTDTSLIGKVIDGMEGYIGLMLSRE